jgi:hypothetical protein
MYIIEDAYIGYEQLEFYAHKKELYKSIFRGASPMLYAIFGGSPPY